MQWQAGDVLINGAGEGVKLVLYSTDPRIFGVIDRSTSRPVLVL